ncbi:katanin p60 ATPase-containing subunit A-like 2 [Rhynchophorus ferrugineus]|uniref:katanin p60 ATPase-containing subunit A-like 2 n=1 Tax=Rhynchophorus ferrugineus TaxID=354439 RepID=UPI003FCDBE50
MANVCITPKNSSRLHQTSLEKIKNEARERRRDVIYLILGYLKENNLEITADSLVKEAKLDDNYQACENVDLGIILQEYQSYYFTKFQRYPKIVRRLDESETRTNQRVPRGKTAKKSTPPPVTKKEEPADKDAGFQFEITSYNGNENPIRQNRSTSKLNRSSPMMLESDQSESKDSIRDQITNQIISTEIGVKWEDCLGLENTVETLKEAAIYPLFYPELFQNISPWRGVLLHGPPGTGKTLLAKALASESHTTFFNVTNSAFISKWRGESEKMIKHLFDLAKYHAPSTIFFDEIDALIPGPRDVQHEAAKRFKSELLVNLDGISSNDEHIIVLASTNAPWDLDNALLRRFDKRILINMPDSLTRIAILKECLKCVVVDISAQEYAEIANLTDCYSGSDIKTLCKEVTMSVIRERIRTGRKNNDVNDKCRKINFADVKTALQKVRPSVNASVCRRYFQWQNEHGST